MKRAMGMWLMAGGVLAAASGMLPADEPGSGAAGDIASPARVTLAAHDEPVAAVLREIQRQTGAAIQKGPLSIPLGSFNVTLEAKDQPLWEVFTEILKQEQIAPQFGPGGPAVEWQIVQGGVSPSNPAAARLATMIIPRGRMLIEEPYLLSLRGITHATDYQMLPVRDRISAEVTMVPDPSVELVSVPGEVKADHATDERGNSLVGPHDVSEVSPVGPLGSLHIVLEPPEAAAVLGDKIVEMDGSIPVREVRSRRVEVTRDKPVTIACSDFSISVELKHSAAASEPASNAASAPARGAARERLDPAGYTLTVEFLRSDETDVAGWNAWFNTFQRLSENLTDAAGNQLRLVSSTGGSAQKSYRRVFNFAPAPGANGGGEISNAVVKLPVLMHVVKVPFKFTDVPLR